MKRTEHLYEQIMLRMDMTRETGEEELQEIIRSVLEQASEEEYIPLQDKIRVSRELFNAFRRLDILQELIEDEQVTEIMINGMEGIFVERAGRLFAWPCGFESGEKLQDVIQQIVAGCNRVVNETSPIVDARLENGSRVNVVLGPIALNAPGVTIRRFPEQPIGMRELLDIGSISEEAWSFL